MLQVGKPGSNGKVAEIILLLSLLDEVRLYSIIEMNTDYIKI